MADQMRYPILLKWIRCVRVGRDGRPLHGGGGSNRPMRRETLFVAQRFETWVIHCHRFRQILQDPSLRAPADCRDTSTTAHDDADVHFR